MPGIRPVKILAPEIPKRFFFGRPFGNPAQPAVISGKIIQLNNKMCTNATI